MSKKNKPDENQKRAAQIEQAFENARQESIKQKKAALPGTEIGEWVFQCEMQVVRVMPIFGYEYNKSNERLETIGFMALLTDSKDYYEMKYIQTVNTKIYPFFGECHYVQPNDTLSIKYIPKEILAQLKSADRYLLNKQSGEYIGEPSAIINLTLTKCMSKQR